VLGVLATGFAAGAFGGALGVGGGVLFIPGLVFFLGQSQLEAEATSLLAIVPVAVVGVWRQRGYGNVRLRDGLAVGLLSPAGVLVGTLLANSIPERTLELLFAAIQLYFAVHLAMRVARDREPESAAQSDRV